MRHLLTAHQQESFLPFSSRQSLSCCLSRVAKRSTPKPYGPLYSPSEPCGPLPFPLEPHGPFFTSPKLPDPSPLPFPSEPRGTLLFYFRTTWTSVYLLAPEPRGSPIYFRAAWSTPFSPKTLWSSSPFTLEPRGPFPHLLWSHVVSSFLPQNLVVLPLQSVTPASILVFFQLYWAAIVSLGRCGPVAWSQSSPSSHAGPVTKGSCFPVPSWVEVTPISLAQSRATAI